MTITGSKRTSLRQGQNEDLSFPFPTARTPSISLPFLSMLNKTGRPFGRIQARQLRASRGGGKNNVIVILLVERYGGTPSKPCHICPCLASQWPRSDPSLIFFPSHYRARSVLRLTRRPATDEAGEPNTRGKDVEPQRCTEPMPARNRDDSIWEPRICHCAPPFNVWTTPNGWSTRAEGSASLLGHAHLYLLDVPATA
ncbi:hypothetical protein LY78DRAFT_284773 [Colletotrichum sublineola]|nr:hypothetical protein LY78DRAFT_284773 [Colletotrichum sublineola]